MKEHPSILYLFVIVGGNSNQCKSPTCDSYPCLVFEDEFETLDFSKWEHEITLGGGGVSNKGYHRMSNLYI